MITDDCYKAQEAPIAGRLTAILLYDSVMVLYKKVIKLNQVSKAKIRIQSTISKLSQSSTDASEYIHIVFTHAKPVQADFFLAARSAGTDSVCLHKLLLSSSDAVHFTHYSQASPTRCVNFSSQKGQTDKTHEFQT